MQTSHTFSTALLSLKVTIIRHKILALVHITMVPNIDVLHKIHRAQVALKTLITSGNVNMHDQFVLMREDLRNSYIYTVELEMAGENVYTCPY